MKKIMFSDAFQLTQAVLDGRKTQTRRIVPKSIFQSQHDIDDDKHKIWIEDMYGDWHDVRKSKYCFKVGEVVAAAQSYKDAGYDPNISQIWTDKGTFIFENCPISQLAGWNNKLFVFAALMPHRIRITDVRVERLNDISDDDCRAEGIVAWTKDKELYKYDLEDVEMFPWSEKPRSPREAYAALIDKIAGKGVWDSNPYVFVYEFELVK